MNVNTYPKYLQKISLTVKSWWRPVTITRILEGPKPENLVVPHEPSVFPGFITAGMWKTSAIPRDVVHTPGRIEIRIDLLGFILKWRMNRLVVKIGRYPASFLGLFRVELWQVRVLKCTLYSENSCLTTKNNSSQLQYLEMITHLCDTLNFHIWCLGNPRKKVIKTKIAGVQFQYL